MRSYYTRSIINTLIASALIMSGCGKKNTVNTTNGSSNPLLATSQSYGGTYLGLKSKMGCLAGRYRLTNDVTFSLNGVGNFSQSQIYGAFSQGAIASGTVTEMYIGMSAWRDLIFVSKVVNGGTVGYNVTLSFCSMPNNPTTLPGIISNERPLTNFRAPYGIILNSNTNCGYGLVAMASNTAVDSNVIANNPYTLPFTAITTFSNQGCF
jgi:hypothetical protein